MPYWRDARLKFDEVVSKRRRCRPPAIICTNRVIACSCGSLGFSQLVKTFASRMALCM